MGTEIKNVYKTLQCTEAALSPKPQLVQRNSVNYTIPETQRREHACVFGALHAARRTGGGACMFGREDLHDRHRFQYTLSDRLLALSLVTTH